LSGGRPAEIAGALALALGLAGAYACRYRERSGVARDASGTATRVE
jgi:hypothetical protein